MNCPKCQTVVQPQSLNIQTDVGQCQSCNHLFKISESLGSSNSTEVDFDMNELPKGTWFRRDRHDIVIGASTRSAIAIFLIPFSLVWCGGSLGGIYGSQILTGKFSLLMSLFGIPFLLGSVVLVSFTLMAILGKVELTLYRYGGKVFTGIGSIGKTKKFKWDDINTITEVSNAVMNSSYRSRNHSRRSSEKILMEGQRRISFGSGLKESRRYYLLKSLQSILSKVKANKSFV